jgi:hypothetical protein
MLGGFGTRWREKLWVVVHCQIRILACCHRSCAPNGTGLATRCESPPQSATRWRKRKAATAAPLARPRTRRARPRTN